MSHSEKRQMGPSEYAAALLESAARDAPFDAARVLGLDRLSASRVHERLQELRLASVLVALLAEEARHPQLLAVRTEVERRVFPATAEEGRDALARVKSAMASVGDLLIALDGPTGN